MAASTSAVKFFWDIRTFLDSAFLLFSIRSIPSALQPGQPHHWRGTLAPGASRTGHNWQGGTAEGARGAGGGRGAGWGFT
jgi:hypothetical protein